LENIDLIGSTLLANNEMPLIGGRIQLRPKFLLTFLQDIISHWSKQKEESPKLQQFIEITKCLITNLMILGNFCILIVFLELYRTSPPLTRIVFPPKELKLL
jgi:hypothetical protein